LATVVIGPQSTRVPCAGLNENMVYERKMDTRDEILQYILNAVRCVNDAVVFLP